MGGCFPSLCVSGDAAAATAAAAATSPGAALQLRAAVAERLIEDEATEAAAVA